MPPRYPPIMKSPVLITDVRDWSLRNEAVFGKKKIIPPAKTIPGRFVVAGAEAPKSKLEQIGESPDGFGKIVHWAHEDRGLALVAFLSSCDNLGVAITGVEAGDSVQIVSATGIASFAEETKNAYAGAYIGIVAAGAKVTAAAFGAPEVAPLIDAAAALAETRFQTAKVKTKRRDPFGQDPGSGHKARQEGGVLISIPRPGVTTQIYYSGNDDHKDRWIKKPGVRDFTHYPKHVPPAGAHFLLSGASNSRQASGAGDIIMVAWDHDFQDNYGYYRLHVLLGRGS